MKPTIPASPSSTTADRQIALLLFAALLAIYLRMIAPGLLGGDSGEFQFAAWRLGLAHATGYPLYLIMGWLWQHLLALVRIEPATALNALSSIFAAGTIALFYRLLVDWLPGSLLLRRMVALLATLFFGLNPTFWSQALIAEVYTLQAFLIVLLLQRAKSVRAWEGGRFEIGLSHYKDLRLGQLILLAFLVGLALTHQATTVFLIPGLLLAIGWLVPGWWRNWRVWMGGGVALLLPLLLYFYVPLRSSVSASPWYHLRLGNETISLYGTGWQGFLNFVSGRSISVGFRDITGAVANLSQAWTLWQIHFGWTGLLLMVLGLITLFRQRNWPILTLTLPFALILQLFNLFYAIGDILVYYIPLYLVGTIWMAFGAAGIGGWGSGGEGEGEQRKNNNATRSDPGRRTSFSAGLLVIVVLFVLPLQEYQRYQPVLDQSSATLARSSWQAILTAKPPANAILVSDNRNEIVPLYYLQHVENFATSLTALFPLITPDQRFADIGATVTTALESGQPVYLIKPMPGLETRFDLEAANPPLVKVVGDAATQEAQIAVNQSLGGLTLLGYDWNAGSGGVQITLHWQVNERLANKYTTTVQLFDAAGEKIAQDDAPPGGDFYPTQLWKPGERLLDRHVLSLPADKKAVKLLVGMYTGQDSTQLGIPIEVEIK
ncbi:MAG: DUF2723 domain-containing protein [Caldilineaceae bacterium]